MLVQKGTVIDGFCIEKLLGRGAMGSVYMAKDEGLGRIVALKILSKEIIKKPKILARFKQEYQVLAKMQHPNIVKIYTYGSVEDTHYFAQEYVKGEDLQVLLDKVGTFPEEEVFKIARAMADAFAHYHPMGIVHRDIKPANIMKLESGPIKIMDFGLVRDEDQTRLTETGGIVGTLAYMSPEVLEGAEPDQKLDIYELGCLLYELLTGQMLLNNKNFLRGGFVELRKRLALLPELSKETDPRLYFVIKHCLHPDTSLRFSDGQQILQILDSTTAPIPDLLPPPFEPEPGSNSRNTEKRSGSSSSKALKISEEGNHAALRHTFPHSKAVNQADQLRKITAVVTTTLTLIFLFMIYFRTPVDGIDKENLSFNNITIRPSVTDILVRWRSNKIHSFSWCISPVENDTEKNDSKENSRKVFKIVNTLSREHQLHIDSLEVDTNYKLTLKSSTGELVTETIKTAGPELLVKPVVSYERGMASQKSKYSIYFETNVSAPFLVIVDSFEKLHPIKTGRQSHHTVEFDLNYEKNLTQEVTFSIQYKGQSIWKQSLPSGPDQVLTVFNNEEIVKETKGKFREFSWTAQNEYTPYRITAGPTTYGKSIILGDKNGFIYSLPDEMDSRNLNSPDYSNLQWAMRLPVDKLGVRFRAVVILSPENSGLMIVGRTNEEIRSFALNTTYREKLWASLLPKQQDGAIGLATSEDWCRTDAPKGEFVTTCTKRYLVRATNTQWGKDDHGKLYIWDFSKSTQAFIDSLTLKATEINSAKPLLFCYSPQDNSLKWSHQSSKSIEEASEPIINGDLLFTKVRKSDYTETLIILNRTTGKLLFSVPLNRARHKLPLSPPLPLDNNRVIAGSGNKVFLISYGQENLIDNNPLVSFYPLEGNVAGAFSRYKDRICFVTLIERLIKEDLDLFDLTAYANFLDYSDSKLSNLKTLTLSKNNIFEELTIQRILPCYIDGTMYTGISSMFVALETADNGSHSRNPYFGQINQQLMNANGYIYFSTTRGYLYRYQTKKSDNLLKGIE
jgi:serine/threonine protein kinase